jgi:hypothetical protein
LISLRGEIQNLSKQIYHLTGENKFKFSKSMGDIMEASFDYMLNNYENHSMLRTNQYIF